MTVFNGGTIIYEIEKYVLTSPLNCWDMNYHLYDKDSDIEYLIDIDDIEEDDLEEIEYLKELAWKIE